jgi:cystathionine gamma-synthase
MEQHTKSKIRLVEFMISSEDLTTEKPPILYLILFPTEDFGLAKQFWQHTGTGISSRFAEYCLVKLHLLFPMRIEAGHLSKQFKQQSREHTWEMHRASLQEERSTWVEERFGRNLPNDLVTEAKIALRKRIAGVIGDSSSDSPTLGNEGLLKGADRQCMGVTQDHVRLFSCGMSAIYFAHQAVTELLEDRRTVQFGYDGLIQISLFGYLENSGKVWKRMCLFWAWERSRAFGIRNIAGKRKNRRCFL